MLFTDQKPSNGDVRRVSLDDDRAVESLIETPADELNASSSPGGRYFVFQSNEDPRWDIQVMDTRTGSQQTVSVEGGYLPLWSRDGSRIIYNYNSDIYAAEVTYEPRFRMTEPAVAFKVKAAYRGEHEATADGSRMLVARPHDPEGTQSANRLVVGVVLNWSDELAALP